MAYSDGVALERYFEEIEELSIPKENKEVIKKFFQEEKAKGIKESTLRSKVYILIRLVQMFPAKKLTEMSKEDTVTFFNEVKPRSKSNNRDKARREFSKKTIITHKINVKSFFKWLNGGKEYSPCVEWIYTGGDTSKDIDENDVLKPEEILALVNKAGTTRDAAFIYTLFETGCRLSEWLDINYNDISLEGRAATVKVDGKTGKRNVYLINSLSYFRDWLNVHPHKDKDNFPIWVSMERLTYGQRIHASSLRKNLQRIKKLAKVKKPVNPHAFRHARATDCARRGYQETLMRKMFGWSKDSNMPSTYIHMVSRDVKDKLLSDAGLEEDYKQKSSAMDMIECPKCGKKYGAGTKFCTCGFVLDEREAQKVDDQRDEKALNALQETISKLASLQSKGFDLEQLNKFAETWVKAQRTK